jgi:hypothetical protein
VRYWKVAVGSVILAAIAVIPIALKGNRKPFVATDNPVAKYKLPWTNEIPWKRAVDLLDFEGMNAPERLEKAQKYLAQRGGGVIYFPPGVYRFQDDLVLQNGIVLRGVTPSGNAKQERYFPKARLEFPRYAPELGPQNSEKETAFKVIRLANPADASNVGVVNFGINRARIVFGQGDDMKAGKNRIVYGCTMTNAAGASDLVPNLSLGQKPSQRFPDTQSPAIDVSAQQNALIANNRLSANYPDNFTMDGYALRGKDGQPRTVDGVVFDFCDRPGIFLNQSLRSASGRKLTGEALKSLEFRKRAGGVIRDNFIYTTGPPAISYSGDAISAGNVTLVHPDPNRPTEDGINASDGPSSNVRKP